MAEITIRFGCNLHPETHRRLSDLAKDGGITMTDVVNRAIEELYRRELEAAVSHPPDQDGEAVRR